jgi:hypothetical protein
VGAGGAKAGVEEQSMPDYVLFRTCEGINYGSGGNRCRGKPSPLICPLAADAEISKSIGHDAFLASFAASVSVVADRGSADRMKRGRAAPVGTGGIKSAAEQQSMPDYTLFRMREGICRGSGGGPRKKGGTSRRGTLG